MAEKKESGKVTAISRKVLARVLPLIIATFLVLFAVIYHFSSNVITDMLYTSLKSQASDDAGTVNRELNATFYYLNGIADTIEKMDWKDDQSITDYLNTTKGRYPLIPTGAYLALNDKSYLDPSGWQSGKDYDPTQSKWYKQGISYDNAYFYYYDEPYFDENTGKLCSTVIRHVHLKDGREGVFACDLMMESIQTALSKVKFYNTGRVMMVTKKGMILANPTSGLNGKTLKESKDPLYTQLVSASNRKNGKVEIVPTSKGKYYTVTSEITGTDWEVIIFAKRADVLHNINEMVRIVAVVAVVALILIAFILVWLLKRYIRKPVEDLTKNIGEIANGDFSIDISANGNDEIAYMNRSMDGFIGGMRGTIKGLKDVAGKLISDSKTTQDAAESLEKAANEQSVSMDQIRDNIQNMADAVTDVAENATTLAMVVSDTKDKSSKAGESMKSTVELSQKGRGDMEKLSAAMGEIENANTALVESIGEVGSASEEITKIVEVISEIADETNLLSLNASIEAARAGESGKGFAVVASQIGSLATNSAESAQNISKLISKVKSLINTVVGQANSSAESIKANTVLINTAVSTFDEIYKNIQDSDQIIRDMVSDVDKVNDVAANVAAISEEQAASSDEILKTSEDMVEKAENITKSSQEVKDNSKELADTSDTLTGYVNRFKI